MDKPVSPRLGDVRTVRTTTDLSDIKYVVENGIEDKNSPITGKRTSSPNLDTSDIENANSHLDTENTYSADDDTDEDIKSRSTVTIKIDNVEDNNDTNVTVEDASDDEGVNDYSNNNPPLVKYHTFPGQGNDSSTETAAGDRRFSTNCAPQRLDVIDEDSSSEVEKIGAGTNKKYDGMPEENEAEDEDELIRQRQALDFGLYKPIHAQEVPIDEVGQNGLQKRPQKLVHSAPNGKGLGIDNEAYEHDSTLINGKKENENDGFMKSQPDSSSKPAHLNVKRDKNADGGGDDDVLRLKISPVNNSGLPNNSNGLGGILKKPASPNPQDREPGMSEGLRRYRRRSQLLSPDIPVDVPLKHRQVEHENRIRGNLEFIKRRVSLQEDQQVHLEPDPRKIAGPRRSLSSPGHSGEDNTEIISLDEGYSTISVSKPRPSVDFFLGSEDDIGKSRRLSRHESPRQSLDLAVPGELSEEEIDEYLGNIPSHQRRYGFPPTPQDLGSLKASARTSPSPKTIAFTEASGQPTADLQPRNSIGEISADGTSFMEPYVPIKKQRKISPIPNAGKMPYQETRRKSSGQDSSFRRQSSASSNSVDSNTWSSITGQRLVSHIRKDSIALFSNKLDNGYAGKLRRFSRVSLAELEQLRQKHKAMTKEELVKQYRIHIFVAAIFFITLLSVSLSWYYRNEAFELQLSSQAIFFDPRTRVLTLADPSDTVRIQGRIGQNIPQWQLPLHCPIVMGDNPYFKECLWKNNAILRIQHFKTDVAQCYNVSWENLHPQHIPYDCFDLQSDVWYGPSNQSTSALPITGEFEFMPMRQSLGNNGLFSSVEDFYWMSSSGIAIKVDGDHPVQISWNKNGNNQMCLLANGSGSIYHREGAASISTLKYTLCSGLNIVTTHRLMRDLFSHTDKVSLPPLELFQGTHWSVRNIVKADNISQDHLTDLMSKIAEYNFQKNTITLDGKWEKEHGDLVFASDRFTNETILNDAMEACDCQLAVSVSPYFHYKSVNFDQGITKSLFLKDAGGEVTALTKYQSELAAVLDVFNPQAIKWYADQLKALTSVQVYRLTYGQNAWLPYKPHFSAVNASTSTYRKLLTETISSVSDSLIVEHTTGTRHVESFIPVVSHIQLVRDKMCITGAIENALTLGLMGYPFVLADGLSVKKYPHTFSTTDTKPSRELFIRWLHLATFFPAYQFSTPPWEYDIDVIYLAGNLSVQHQDLVKEELQKEALLKEIEQGLPIMRPVWWLDPRNKTLHNLKVNDEFLVGNDLLVAPILCENVNVRDIYVPPGVWEDAHYNTFILGPSLLRNYQVMPERIALFKRREVVGEEGEPDL